MKPTREQVIAWAREAGVINCDCCLPFWPEEDQVNWEIFFERFAALAYEAGRKDENEACAQIVGMYQIPVGNSAAGEMACEWTYDALKEVYDAIRARREQ